MSVSFNNLTKHVISMDEFSMQWRFIEKKYDQLPKIDLDQLKPLNRQGSEILWDHMYKSFLHSDFVFKKDFFDVIDDIRINENNSNEKEIKSWLSGQYIPIDNEVYLSWSSNLGMIVPWKLLMKYYNSFYYPVSDDLTVIDKSLKWALIFFHEHMIYFGRAKIKVSNNI